MLKYIFRCWLSLGDIVLLTGAVRDLKLHFPGRYAVDVRSWFPDLWKHNPHLTPLGEYDPDVKVVDCAVPLVNFSHSAGCHAVHAFTDFLNQYLGVRMKPAAFRGDIHLSRGERGRPSNVQELTGADIPFWLISAGGKHDCTIKWWDAKRYQEVVDHFRGRIQFVQVGDAAHYHPKLQGVIDLRGRTSVRELVRLVHHAQGVLCGVTGLMHLAAAVPLRKDRVTARPCVVVAGGREPPHWEAYPGHQFIHTVGALPCCAHGGCWKARTEPLGDGDERDVEAQMCLEVKNGLPRCMDMISSNEVIRRVETYFAGGAARYLSSRETKLAATAANATTATMGIAARPLNFYTAPELASRCIEQIPPYPDGFSDRGIVICAGGTPMFTNAWVCINMLRWLGCKLPIQLWHSGKTELDARMRGIVAPLGVKCVDVEQVRRTHPANLSHVWAVKPYAVLHSRFKQVLLLDADNVPIRNPEYLFDAVQFRKTGAVFWPDYWSLRRESTAWKLFGIPFREGREFETGQLLVDKSVCWRSLNLALWYNENHQLFYQHVYGDKQTFQMAFMRLDTPYAMPSREPYRLPGVMCQHDLEGRRLFQHRTRAKWSLFASNRRIRGFQFDKECREFLRELQERWDGAIESLQPRRWEDNGAEQASGSANGEIKVFACMVSFPEREAELRSTLANLRSTDWGDRPVHVVMDEQRFAHPEERLAHSTWRALQAGLGSKADFILLLQDGLEFNQRFLQNLCSWRILNQRQLTLASLLNSGNRELARVVAENAVVVDPRNLVSGHALVMSRRAARLFVENWSERPASPCLKMGLLSTRLRNPVFCHAPSLVRRVRPGGVTSKGFLQALDFKTDWVGTHPSSNGVTVLSWSQESAAQ